MFYSVHYKNGCVAASDLFHLFTRSINFYTFHYLRKPIRATCFSGKYNLRFQDRSFFVKLLLEVELLFEVELLLKVELLFELE